MTRVIYAWLLPPGLFFVLFCVAFFFFIKTKKNGWLVLPFIGMYLFSIYVVSSMLIKPLENWFKQPVIGDLNGAQAIVILGGGSYYGVPDIDGQGQAAPCFANRLLAGIRLYKMLKVPIIISGTGEEVKIAFRLLNVCGVEQKEIFTENRSQNTVQNAKFTKDLCQKNKFEKIILVTSASHLPRAAMLFQREGMHLIPYPTDYRTHGVKVMNLHVFTPTYESLSNSAVALKEYLGIVALKLGVL